jgi:SM-20-related protein
MSAIDLDAFRATPLEREPYDHLVVPGFLRSDAARAIEADYPEISGAGSYPLSELQFGPAFAAMIDELQTPEVEGAFAEKFDIELTDRPTMITVRGRCRLKDGRIHTDTEDKLITVLVYLNTDWQNPNGRLRILRSGADIEDYASEVPPRAGTLLAFRRGDRSYHGHTSFEGVRRVIQLNWVKDSRVERRERNRHRYSARIKKLLPFS